MSILSTPLRRTAVLDAMVSAVLFGALAVAGPVYAETSIKDLGSAGAEPPLGKRIVAVGDIHGAYNGVRTILREAALLDDEDDWAGADAILVQTGDFLDRGPGAVDVARLLMKLQRQAPESGGEVVVLLGNHEVLNLIGDLRDVTEEILDDFIDRHSEKRLEVSCNEYVALKRRWAAARDEKPPSRRELRDKCFAEQHLGEVEYLEEVGPQGEIGRWLRSLPSAVRIGGVVFVHGGISPELAGRSLEQINADVRREIDALDHAREHLLDRGLILPTSSLPEMLAAARAVQRSDAEAAGNRTLTPPEIRQLLEIDEWQMIRDDGPLWFRGYARWNEDQGRELMPAILESLGAEHVVVAHTPQRSKRITTRFDDRVFLIDTGMLTSVYKGAPSALEIRDGRFTAVYIARETVLLDAGEEDADIDADADDPGPALAASSK